MNDADRSPPLNWTAIAALYSALGLGFAWMLYWGDYRNAAWLGLLGMGGGLTAYGRVLKHRGHVERAKHWTTGAALFYLVFFVWAGTVLLRVVLGR